MTAQMVGMTPIHGQHDPTLERRGRDLLLIAEAAEASMRAATLASVNVANLAQGTFAGDDLHNGAIEGLYECESAERYAKTAAERWRSAWTKWVCGLIDQAEKTHGVALHGFDHRILYFLAEYRYQVYKLWIETHRVWHDGFDHQQLNQRLHHLDRFQHAAAKARGEVGGSAWVQLQRIATDLAAGYAAGR